ncbi:MAG: class I SAM-dependent methyltransferase [Patescibacteria group bacterium]
MQRKSKTTSWGEVAEWYDVYLEGDTDSYQRQVILPNLLRVLNIARGERVLDLACGQGFFAREFAKLGAKTAGADISPELVKIALQRSPESIDFHAMPAHKLSFARNGEFDAVIAVHALQNIENINEVFAEVRRVLAEGGRFVMVLNHPTFRIPKRSSWGWDEKIKTQYRRIDRYLSSEKVAIEMHPGEKVGERTFSYHRSLQDFFKALIKNGFAVSRLEEWISHKKSGRGPRQIAEDTARKEIPLFLMLEAKILQFKK